MAALSLAPLMHQEFQVIPVISFSNKTQMDEMILARNLKMSEEDIKRINEFF